RTPVRRSNGPRTAVPNGPGGPAPSRALKGDLLSFLNGGGWVVDRNGGVPFVLREGDCRSILRGVPDHSFDAIVTDPGVGTTDDLDGWTKGVPGRSFWEEFLRVVRPGAHMAVFSGRKTDHRVLTYAEEAGWEIRD